MNTVETASSLFDIPDASDPFSTLSSDPGAPVVSSTAGVRTDIAAPNDDSVSFERSGSDNPEVTSLFSQHQTLDNSPHSWTSAETLPTQDFYAYNNATVGQNYGSHYSSGTTPQGVYQGEGWYDEQGQWHANENAHHAGTDPFPYVSQYSYPNAPATYSYGGSNGSPVTAASYSSSDGSATSYTTSSSADGRGYPPQTTTYNPYNPSTAKYVSQAPPVGGVSSNAAQASPYTPYASGLLNGASVNTTSIPLVPPPASSAPPVKLPISGYRPAKYNAYDPPLPAMRSNRKASAPAKPPPPPSPQAPFTAPPHSRATAPRQGSYVGHAIVHEPQADAYGRRPLDSSYHVGHDNAAHHYQQRQTYTSSPVSADFDGRRVTSAPAEYQGHSAAPAIDNPAAGGLYSYDQYSTGGNVNPDVNALQASGNGSSDDAEGGNTCPANNGSSSGNYGHDYSIDHSYPARTAGSPTPRHTMYEQNEQRVNDGDMTNQSTAEATYDTFNKPSQVYATPDRMSSPPSWTASPDRTSKASPQTASPNHSRASSGSAHWAHEPSEPQNTSVVGGSSVLDTRHALSPSSQSRSLTTSPGPKPNVTYPHSILSKGNISRSTSPAMSVRAGSPAGSINSWKRQSGASGFQFIPVDPVAPISAVLAESSTYDPYKPSSSQNVAIPQRATSPSKASHPADPYAPGFTQYTSPQSNQGSSAYRDRSTSNISIASSSPAAPYNPSVPLPSAYSQARDAPAYVDQRPAYTGLPFVGHQPTMSQDSMQELMMNPTYTAYAPSPSLLGTNDPLGRATAKVPIISFGFGGKLLTCFHSAPTLATGFDVALSSRQSTDVHIRLLHKVIPESVVDASSASYPGPLFGDPGSPSVSIVRPGQSNQVKTKKAKVIKYLEERCDEIGRGVAYLSPGSISRAQAEGKLVLVRLLKAMLENDGQLTGTPEIDAAVREALLPRLAIAPSVAATTPMGFAMSGHTADGAVNGYANIGAKNGSDHPVAVYDVRPSHLDTIQEFLLRGDRKQAYHYALDEKMWAHAMVISSSVDKDAFREVVNEFIKTELGVKDDKRHGAHLSTRPDGLGGSATNGRESLRVAYSLFSGQAAAAVQELLPPKFLLGLGADASPQPAINHLTPLSPNFPAPALTTKIPMDALMKWQETAAMILGGQMGADSSSALTTLGDYLVANQFTEAGHCCYLLSPLSSLIGGLGLPNARIVLLGSQNPQRYPMFHKNPDPIIFTEIAEFGFSLRPPNKGQEPFTGFPHLQAYRLIRAETLAELGHVAVGQRYCEAVSASTTRTSPYFNPILAAQLKELSNRLLGNVDLDKNGSWIGGRINKPSLDSIGDWLGGRLSKFVAGEGESSPNGEQETVAPNGKEYSGAFSHYSAISSTNSSQSPSPAPSVINPYSVPTTQPRRSGSAMALRPAGNPQAPIDRASSAMDHLRPSNRRSSPAPRVLSANAATTTFAQSTSFSQLGSIYHSPLGPANGQNHYSDSQNVTPADDSAQSTYSPSESNGSPVGQEATSWWGSSYGDDSNGATPTATTFFKVDAPESPSGFISLMDDYTPSPSSSHISLSHPSASIPNDIADDDDDELGLGNAKPKKSVESVKDATAREETKKEEAVPKKPDVKLAASSGSWLGRWWGRGSSTSGPIKASLGEETTFYFDPELKKWVNKKAGAEPAKPNAPPPPPARAQTASPTRAAFGDGPVRTGPPPPARPASAVDLSTSPTQKAPVRTRSNLVPPEHDSALPSPNPAMGPPPPGRPKSAAKRNVRNRYVDVFQQNGAP